MNLYYTNTLGLVNIIKNGWINQYNRCFDPENIKSLQLDPAGVHIVSNKFTHHHKDGVLVEPHFRCLFMYKKENCAAPNIIMLDCEIDVFFEQTEGKFIVGEEPQTLEG